MEKLLKSVYKNKTLTAFLRILSHLASIFTFILFCFTTAAIATTSLVSALRFCVVIGAPYVIVSVARRMINAKRPYELYDFYETAPKNKTGVSFPSRHSFLIFAIATASLPISPVAASILFVLGVLLAISRVLTGIHFIRDVLAGALIGIFISLVGLFILSPF